MNINNYSYSGGGKQPKRDSGGGNGIGAGYIIMLIIFVLVFVVMAFLFFGMRNHLKKQAEEETSTEEVADEGTEDEDQTVYYEGFKEIINDTFSNKAGFYYSIEVSPSDDNAYFMTDSILKDVTDGQSYSITGNVLEKGVSGRVNVLRDDYPVSYEYGFSQNASILNADLTDYLRDKGLDEDSVLEKGYVSNVSLEEQASGIMAVKGIRDALFSGEISDEGEDEGEYRAVFKQGTFNVDTGCSYIDRLFNDYPGDMTVTITTEDLEEEGQTKTYIYIEGPVAANITLDEYKTLETSDLLISEAYNHSETGVFEAERSLELSDFFDSLSGF